MMLPVDTLNQLSWMLDPDIAYLNHGSFGARSVDVFEAQIELKTTFERSPIQFLDREGKERVFRAREVVSSFLGCSPTNLGFIENATTGVGCVLQSLSLPEGSEILSTSHVYNGVRQLLRAASSRSNWKYREISVPTPLFTNSEIVETIVAEFTTDTSLLVIDHVASVTGIVFPVKELVEECKNRGIMILIDGAHAPGMLDIDIDALLPDWYIGNLHKWVCGPPGAGFLWVHDAHLDSTHPMTVSHFYEQGFTQEFDWQGTRDITSILCAALAVEWGDNIGWDKIRNHNHALAISMQNTLVNEWNTEPLSPLDGSLVGAMVTVQLPVGFSTESEHADAMQLWIYEEFKVEIPIMQWQDRAVVRASAQLYTSSKDIQRLLIAVEASKQHFFV